MFANDRPLTKLGYGKSQLTFQIEDYTLEGALEYEDFLQQVVPIWDTIAKKIIKKMAR